MKRTVLLVLVGMFILGVAGASQAEILLQENLILNPGFELAVGNDFADWTEGGNVAQQGTFVLSGDYAAKLGPDTGYLYQSFLLPDADELVFGAYFQVLTDSLTANWDQLQINMQVVSDNTTIGGSISNLSSLLGNPGLFTEVFPGVYASPWFLVYDTIDITGYTPGANASININLQNFASPYTVAYVDDAFAGAPVPEPSTVLLLGMGLVGLAAYGRKRMKK